MVIAFSVVSFSIFDLKNRRDWHACHRAAVKSKI